MKRLRKYARTYPPTQVKDADRAEKLTHLRYKIWRVTGECLNCQKFIPHTCARTVPPAHRSPHDAYDPVRDAHKIIAEEIYGDDGYGGV